MKHKFVYELMTSPAISCDYSSNIKETINIMKEKNIGFLPVTKSNIIVGVVTDRDILIRGIGIYKLNSKIHNVMTSGDIYYVSPDTPLIDAAKIMADKKIRRLAVLNDGKVCGVLTTKNLLNEPSLISYVAQTYLPNSTIDAYSLYLNSNPHDSVKAEDFPL